VTPASSSAGARISCSTMGCGNHAAANSLTIACGRRWRLLAWREDCLKVPVLRLQKLDCVGRARCGIDALVPPIVLRLSLFALFSMFIAFISRTPAPRATPVQDSTPETRSVGMSSEETA
jgi:hypothetical protein